jgi:transcriptional regulator with PAS, ATPase and Fis domain
MLYLLKYESQGDDYMNNAELREKWFQLHKDTELRDKLPPYIKYSWERCYDMGIDPMLDENPYICTEYELEQARSRSQYLLSISEPVMRDLYEFVAGTGFVVALADSDVCVLKVIGDKESLAWANSAHFVEGSMWSESLVGTNAGSLSIDLAKPISVFGYEHFCLFSHVAASSCAPITDQDKICGSLVMVAPHNKVTKHTLGMVVAAAKHIMSTMVLERANQYHKAVMESMSEGVLALDSNGIITYMNDNCGHILEISGRPQVGLNISDVLGTNVDNHYFINKVTQGRIFTDENFKFVTLKKNTVKCNVTCTPLTQPDTSCGGTVVIIKESNRMNRLVQKWIGDGAKITFEDVIGEDAKYQHVLKTAKAAASSMSNVLLLGESGTGKDVLAQSMHNASSRKDYPYVAINCAALPRELIASELFGYDEGAFTGARKGGNVGKFELADEGTIFLDEIGDMPLDLQASLLRVLEEKTVIRLGGSKLIPINVRIIAATNKDLENQIKRNRFRRDLYYRLSVIKITLPPLRERPDDILLLAKKFMEKFCIRFGKPSMILAPDVTDAFLKYQWPGNIRELQNVIEGAIQLTPGNVVTYDIISEYLTETGTETPKYQVEQSQMISTPAVDNEEQMLLDNLIKYKHNKSEVAKAMGISRKTLYRRLKEHGIS